MGSFFLANCSTQDRSLSCTMASSLCSQAIEAFQRDPPTTVFLLSMRSGAVGINLTAANHVFILEPAMNPALEDQAVGRAFRMGQTRPVVVKKLYIKVRAASSARLLHSTQC
jgi:SWI/SNF-related matrix-associated actin-dependent regulator of chromatin subfamily A3